MYQLVLVLALAATAYGYGRIVGGEDAEIENFNYQVSLRYFSSHKCGGSLVTPSVVVTAAHCIHGWTYWPERFSINAGSSNVNTEGQVRTLKKINQDARYDPYNTDYDVTVVILIKPVELSEKVGLVELIPRGFRIEVGTPSVVTGWGAIRQGSGVHPQLQAVKVPYVDWDDCNKRYDSNRLTARMSCWGYVDVGGKDACQGDSGGPLVIYDEKSNPRLTGIVSWGRGCALPSYPGVYADVTNVEIYDFIAQYL